MDNILEESEYYCNACEAYLLCRLLNVYISCIFYGEIQLFYNFLHT